MVSVWPLQALGDCSKLTNYNWYHYYLHMLFRSIARSKYCSHFSFSLIFTLTGWQIHELVDSLFFSSFFFITITRCLVFWPGLGDLFVSQNPKEFILLILQDRFWFVYIPFCSMVKFQFVAQFPVIPLHHPVMSSFVLILCVFAAFSYN